MRRRLFLGTLAVGFLVLGSHGQAPHGKPKAGGEGQPGVAKSAIPAELEALNHASRQLYSGGRALELFLARGLVLIDAVLKAGRVSADDLVNYCRASRPDVLANAATAVRAQLVGTHR
jgi:hypothetical protein